VQHAGAPDTAAESAQSQLDRAWGRVGRVAGYVAGVGLLVATILYLLDASDALGAGPEFRKTAAGELRDEANFWVAYFAHKHDILWDIVARDIVFPIAFVALIVVALAVRNLVGFRRPEAQLMTAFFFVGATLAALSDVMYLGATDYWRATGWTAQPPERMVAVGRSLGPIDAMTRWTEVAGFAILSAALICLWRLSRLRLLPVALGVAAGVEALLLIGIAIAEAMHADDAYDILSLVTGAVVGPLVAIWLGWYLGTARARAAAASG
jgi:hypothetical protein